VANDIATTAPENSTATGTVLGWAGFDDSSSVAAVRARAFEYLSRNKRETPPDEQPPKRVTVEPGGVVYFLRCGETGPVKIGWSGSMTLSRIRSLQTAHYEDLTVIGYIVGGRSVEGAWHKRFRLFRIRGEWFEPAPELLAAIAVATGDVSPNP